MTTQTVHQQLGEFTTKIASQASEFVAQTRLYRDKYFKSKAWLERFDKHWGESNLGLSAIACGSATVASLALGWDMYDSVLTDLFFTGEETAPWYAVVGLSLFLSSFSLITGVVGARAFNGKYREWLHLQEVGAGALEEASRHSMKQEHAKDHAKFAGMLLLTFLVIMLIVWQRYVWLSVEKGESSFLDFLLLGLPLATFIFEVISSEGALLWLRRNLQEYQMDQYYKEFKKMQSQTAELDKQVAMQWRKAIREGESLMLLADVKCALHRSKFRSTDDENYSNEITEDIHRAAVQAELILEN